MTQLTLEQIQALANQAAETGDDMTVVVKGGGGAKLLPAGNCLGRLVRYVEYGNQPQEFGGKAQDPAPEFQLGFALYGEGYQNEDGTPYIMSTYPIKRSRNEKAGAYLLFKALNWKGTATHFAQLVGQAFIVNIENKTPKDATKAARSTINLKGFLPPLDPVTRSPYAVPEARADDLGLFLWDYPTLDAWNSLYIDGTYDDGSSKNWLQGTLLAATNFAGSALESLLVTSGTAFTVPAPKAAPPSLPAAPAVPNLVAAPAPVVAAPLGIPALPVAPPVTLPPSLPQQ